MTMNRASQLSKWAAVFLLLWGTTAAAQYRRHRGRYDERARYEEYSHDGFYFHLEGGFGGLESSSQNLDPNLSISGLTGVIGVGIGGAVAPDWMLSGELAYVNEPRHIWASEPRTDV